MPAKRGNAEINGGDVVPHKTCPGPMKKPSKTAAELEASIKVEMEDICSWPTPVSVEVRPDGDSWKVVITQEGPAGDGEGFFEMILLIADRIRCQFDLKI
jgi:hypothetical protein